MDSKRLLHPLVLFGVFFVVPFLMAFIPFAGEFINIEPATTNVVVLGVVGFVVGVAWASFVCKLASRRRYNNRLVKNVVHIGSGSFYFLAFFGAIGAISLGFEFVSLGGIPVFMDDVEMSRFGLQINGYIHLVAINTGFVGALALIAATEAANASMARRCRWLGIVCLLLVSLVGNRSDVFIPLVVFVAYLILTGRVIFNLKICLIFIGFIFLLGLIKHFREILAVGDEYLEMVEGQVDYKFSYFILVLYPLYMTFAYNFEMFDRLVALGDVVHTGGVYTFYPFYSLLPGHQLSFGEYKNQLLGVDFYSGLTSTYMSNLYIDFGLFGVIFGSFIIAFIFCFLYKMCVQNLFCLFVYSVLVPRLIMCFYVFPFEQFNVYFQIFEALFFCWVCTRSRAARAARAGG